MTRDETPAAYFRRRADAESAVAAVARIAAARERHSELAELYRRRASELDGPAAAV